MLAPMHPPPTTTTSVSFGRLAAAGASLEGYASMDEKSVPQMETDEEKQISAALLDRDVVLIVGGLGGELGGWGMGLVGRVARILGDTTMALATIPFGLEGPIRRRLAETQLRLLQKRGDGVITFASGPRMGPIAAFAGRRSGRGPSLWWDVTRSRFLSLDSAGLKYLVLLGPVLRTLMGDRMSSTGKEIRLRRLFSGGKALVVAMDHGVSSGPVGGLEDIRKAVANAAKGGATGVVLHKGVVRFAKDYFDERLALVIHLSASTSLSTRGDRKVLVTEVDEAIAHGADAVSVHVNLGGDDDDRMLADLGATAGGCSRFGLPLLAMMYPRGSNVKNPYDVDVVKHVARVGAELGADVVKTVYTGSSDTFREVIRGCPVPVLVAGGPKLDSDRAALGMVEGAIAGGAAGVSIGRNVFQSKDPIGMTRAIARVLFEGASADDVYCG